MLTNYMHRQNFEDLLGLNSLNDKKSGSHNSVISFPNFNISHYINSKKEGFKLNENFQNNGNIYSTILPSNNINAKINNSEFRTREYEKKDIIKFNSMHSYRYKTFIKNNKVNEFKNREILPNSEYIFGAPFFNSNAMMKIYKDDTQVKTEFNFKQILGEENIQKFSEGGVYCNIDKNLYFTGGEENGQTFLQIKIIKEYNNYIAHFIKMPSMINSHSNHSMIGNEKYLFVVGGYACNKCEYFDMKNFKWNEITNLISNERQRPMLIIHEDYLYAFMGFTQENILSSIERINIKSIKTSKWENVNVLNPIKFFGSGIYAINKKIFFIGGKSAKGSKEEDYINFTIFFDLEKNIFGKMNNSYHDEELYFIENKFHDCNSDELGNFSYANHGQVTIAKSYFID